MLLLWFVRATLTHEVAEGRSHFYRTVMKSRLKVAFVATLIIGTTVVGAIVGAKPAQAQTVCGVIVHCATTDCVNNRQCYSVAIVPAIAGSGPFATDGTQCATTYVGWGCQIPQGHCGGSTHVGRC